jgi:hypothetical protein
MNRQETDTDHTPSACNEFRERISSQSDDRGSDAIAWRRHALACGACASFEANLRSVHIDLGLVRGTPIRDLWPEIAMKLASTPTHKRPVRTIGTRAAMAAVGAGIMWSSLAFISQRSGASTHRGLERSLAALSLVSTTPDEIVHTDSVPEVRLLARIAGNNGEQR